MNAKLLVSTVAILTVSFGVFAQKDPTIGTWKLNLAKSTYNAGQPPKSTTIVIEAAGDGTKVTADTVLSDGTSRRISYTATYDGKDSKVTGSPDYDMVSIKRTAPSTTEGERKKGGRVLQTFKRTVSADGKTMTVMSKGISGGGQKVDNVLVYDKQ
jgi:hypothetical protein